jgi:RNA polymerase sigma-70 factor (ECF subfamily)
MSDASPAGRLEELATHAGWLRRIARALVRDDDAAADVVQEALIQAWERPPVVTPELSGRPWLLHVVRRRAQDLRRGQRRRARREEIAIEVADTTVSTPEELVGSVELHRAIAAAVAALDEPYREAVVLRHYEGLSAAEIAQRLGVPAGTIRWRLKEGLDRVRRRLDGDCGGRRRWMVALAPLVRLRPEPAGGSPPAGPRAISWSRAASWGLGALAAVVVAGAVALVLRAPPPAGPGREDGAETTTPATRGARASDRPAPPRFAAPPRPVTTGSEAPLAAAGPEPLVRQMLAALASGSYGDFLLHAGDELKAAMLTHLFHDAAAEVGPALRGGFRLQPLGALRKEDGVLHLWRVTPLTDPDDEILVNLLLRDGKALAFRLQ